jgi:restriction system protein
MQFKDAAYVILTESGEPLHYREITTKALEKNLLETAGRTPESTMVALLYTDTLNSDSRFVRGKRPGTFALKSFYTSGIQQQIDEINVNFRKELRSHILKLSAQKFEELILRLLEAMGFEETEKTSFSNDKGVDVRGVLRSNPLSVVKVAVQAKKWKHNVGSDIVRNLRGSLRLVDSEQGIIITPSDFTTGAVNEAKASGRTPIQLINGEQLLELLIQYHVGVKDEEYTIPVIDQDYWKEVLDVNILEQDLSKGGNKKPTKEPKAKAKLEFPITIQGTFRGVNYQAKLLSLEGMVEFNGKKYQTPSTAAKIITTDWKSVNGWDFWHYLDPETGKLEKIGTLRNKK